jgi:hypothetical protein
VGRSERECQRLRALAGDDKAWDGIAPDLDLKASLEKEKAKLVDIRNSLLGAANSPAITEIDKAIKAIDKLLGK